MFKDPQERQARVERLAGDFFAKLQKERPDLAEKLGRDNILCDVRMEIANSLPLDEESEGEMREYREQERQDAAELQGKGLTLEELLDPERQADMILNPERYTSKDSEDTE